jgi:peptide-methionine (S)-S-oxide reductase
MPKNLLRYVLPLITLIAGAAGLRAGNFPAPTVDEQPHPGTEKAVLAGGCFWGVEGVYDHVKGVKIAVSGFSGGSRANADYETVSTGTTGHAESVEVTYDPSQITYGQILMIYFAVAHDPTELNRQGPDSGTQYRSAIFYANDDQKRIAEAYIHQLDAAGIYHRKIVTQVVPLKGFYAAEEHHQHFLDRNPNYPYIVYNDLPKLVALKKEYPEMCKR